MDNWWNYIYDPNTDWTPVPWTGGLEGTQGDASTDYPQPTNPQTPGAFGSSSFENLLRSLLRTGSGAVNAATTPAGLSTLLGAGAGYMSRTPPSGGGTSQAYAGPKPIARTVVQGRYGPIVQYGEPGTLPAPITPAAPRPNTESSSGGGFTSYEHLRPADWNPAEQLPPDWNKYVSKSLYPSTSDAYMYNPQLSYNVTGKPALDLLGRDRAYDIMRMAASSGDVSKLVQGMGTKELEAAGALVGNALSGTQQMDPAYERLSNARNQLSDMIFNAYQGGISSFAHGGHVNMEDGGFVLTKRAVDGAGGPRGLAALVPQARMIRGPGTGTSDSIPASIRGQNGVTPAKVSNGEAYVPRRAVRQAGGPQAMYALMNKLQRRA